MGTKYPYWPLAFQMIINCEFKCLNDSVDHCLCINITMCTHHWALCTFVLESRYEGICKLYNMVGTAYIKPHTTCYVYIQVCYIVQRWCAEQFCTMKLYYLQRKKTPFSAETFNSAWIFKNKDWQRMRQTILVL